VRQPLCKYVLMFATIIDIPRKLSTALRLAATCAGSSVAEVRTYSTCAYRSLRHGSREGAVVYGLAALEQIRCERAVEVADIRHARIRERERLRSTCVVWLAMLATYSEADMHLRNPGTEVDVIRSRRYWGCIIGFSFGMGRGHNQK